MHIKSIIVEGFKSYKHRTCIELSGKHNVIVGKNGSGKSNIFAAIQFVLSDRFSNLRQDERQRLVHEGAGRQSLAASVEIIFNNEDMRFPIEQAEVSLKRTVGMKKDEFQLNRKHSSKADIESLLESAGLSRSNPYYIVQQGRVNSIIKMKDSERLDLLKEIAGTRVYDERRCESTKIMHDADAKSSQIKEIIDFIESRLRELENEKTELRKFQENDRDRRCIEFAIYEKESQNASTKLEEIERTRSSNRDQVDQAHVSAAGKRDDLVNLQNESSVLDDEIKDLELKKKTLVSKKRHAVQKHSQCELQVRDIELENSASSNARNDMTEELQHLENRVKDETKKLKKLQAQFEDLNTKEKSHRMIFTTNSIRLQTLCAKQGRFDQFGKKSDRDKHLKEQIKILRNQVAATKKQKDEVDQSIVTSEQAINEQKDVQVSLSALLLTTQQKIESIDTNYRKTKLSRAQATESRKETRKSEHLAEGKKSKLQDELKVAESDLRYVMSREQFASMKIVRNIASNPKVRNGYFGPICELFTVKHEKFRKSVEVVAGSRLFYHVVDTDETAEFFIKELDRLKAGRQMFMPLNRISSEHGPSAGDLSSDVLPMMDQLEFDPKFTNAMSQIFGKTLIARTIEVGTNNARKFNVDTVTLDGQQSFRKGTLKGGNVEFRRSRLKAVFDIQEATRKLAELEKEMIKLGQECTVKEQKVNELIGSLSKFEAEKKHHLKKKIQLEQEVVFAEQERDRLLAAVSKSKLSAQMLDISITETEDRENGLRGELNSKFEKALSPKEQGELEQLKERILQNEAELGKLLNACNKVDLDRNKVENLLQSNLLKRVDEVKHQLLSVDVMQQAEQLDRLSHEMNDLADEITDADALMNVAEKSLDTKVRRVREIHKTIESVQETYDKLLVLLRDSSKELEKLLSKRQGLEEKKVDCQTKIRNLGSLPQNASERYQRHSVKKLMKMVQKVNIVLKKFSHVNKKALDQYVTFTQRRNNLVLRKEEQDRGKSAIESLIEHLDQKKDEAINRTFKQIAKHFSTVFKELVPCGKGTIVIQTRKKSKKRSLDSEGMEHSDQKYDSDSDSASDNEQSSHSGAEYYTGVGIKVSFTGSGETFRMSQLSGGQQTVVALSLIFAIQRCDPSPFYLFDEIDSNLDSVHRTAVARMIEKLASAPAQFITTTFRPELLASGNMFFCVSYENKVSTIANVRQESAHSITQLCERATVSE